MDVVQGPHKIECIILEGLHVSGHVRWDAMTDRLLGDAHLKREDWFKKPNSLLSSRLPSRCERPSEVVVALPGRVHSDGRQVYRAIPVTCRKCSHCRRVKLNSKAAAIWLEARESPWVAFLTLTVSPAALDDHPLMDSLLDWRHVSLFMKRLRMNFTRSLGSGRGRAVGDCRFFGCGELGAQTSRAHYHVLIWGDGEKPLFLDHAPGPDGRGVMIHLPEWTFGHTFVVAGHEGSARYVAKYLQKADAVRGQHFVMGGSQSIGAAAAYERGVAVAEAGASVPTHRFLFTFQNSIGENVSAAMMGVQRKWFLRGFMDQSGLTLDDLLRVMPLETHPQILRMRREDLDRQAKLQATEDFMSEFGEGLRRASEAQFRDERDKAARAKPFVKPDPRWTPESEGRAMTFDESVENERLRRDWSARHGARNGGSGGVSSSGGAWGRKSRSG